VNGAPVRDGAPTLLVLRALGLGDFLTGLPAVRALAAAFPDHRRVLAMPAPLEPLARLAGVTDEVLPAAGVRSVEPLDSRWTACHQGVDVAVNLHGRGPESHRALLATAPRRLVAFAHPDVPASSDGPLWDDGKHIGEHEVTRWCRLLEAYGIPVDPTNLDLAPAAAGPVADAVEPVLAARARGATVVHPGASSGARRWPVERWAAVAQREHNRGRTVLVTGSGAERELAWRVASLAALPSEAVLAGRTSVVELTAVVDAAGTVLCGDTGVAHLATAVGTPSVVLFGPTPPSRWGPPPGRPIHRALWSGAVGDPHGDRPDRGLLAISVGQVLAAAEEVRAAASEARTG